MRPGTCLHGNEAASWKIGKEPYNFARLSFQTPPSRLIVCVPKNVLCQIPPNGGNLLSICLLLDVELNDRSIAQLRLCKGPSTPSPPAIRRNEPSHSHFDHGFWQYPSGRLRDDSVRAMTACRNPSAQFPSDPYRILNPKRRPICRPREYVPNTEVGLTPSNVANSITRLSVRFRPNSETVQRLSSGRRSICASSWR